MIFIPLVLSAFLGLIRRLICLVHCEITSVTVISTAETRNVSKYSHSRVLAPYPQDVQTGPHSSRVPRLLSNKFGICSITNKKKILQNLDSLEPNIHYAIYPCSSLQRNIMMENLPSLLNWAVSQAERNFKKQLSLPYFQSINTAAVGKGRFALHCDYSGPSKVPESFMQIIHTVIIICLPQLTCDPLPAFIDWKPVSAWHACGRV